VSDEPALELATAQALLRRVARGDQGETLHVHRPAAPTVAFGRRDLRLPGFEDAVAAVRAAGFTPVVRPQGGRAVAYTSQTLVVDHVCPDPQWPSGLEARFGSFGEVWVDVLRGLGADARLGEVPGEYCPGSHSINARGAVKLVGTAQRMVRGAWLFSAVLVHDGAPRLRALLHDVYGAMGLAFEDASVGSLAEEVPGLALDTVEAAVLAAYQERLGLTRGEPGPGLLAEAGALVDDHRL
jgi:lipoate-protein ligase A